MLYTVTNLSSNWVPVQWLRTPPLLLTVSYLSLVFQIFCTSAEDEDKKRTVSHFRIIYLSQDYFGCLLHSPTARPANPVKR